MAGLHRVHAGLDVSAVSELEHEDVPPLIVDPAQDAVVPRRAAPHPSQFVAEPVYNHQSQDSPAVGGSLGNVRRAAVRFPG